jgi:hypothetical protein
MPLESRLRDQRASRPWILAMPNVKLPKLAQKAAEAGLHLLERAHGLSPLSNVYLEIPFVLPQTKMRPPRALLTKQTVSDSWRTSSSCLTQKTFSGVLRWVFRFFCNVESVFVVVGSYVDDHVAVGFVSVFPAKEQEEELQILSSEPSVLVWRG